MVTARGDSWCSWVTRTRQSYSVRAETRSSVAERVPRGSTRLTRLRIQEGMVRDSVLAILLTQTPRRCGDELQPTIAKIAPARQRIQRQVRGKSAINKAHPQENPHGR